MISSPQKIFTKGNKLVELIFFPSFCKLCSALLELPQEKVICNTCWEQVKTRSPSHCLCCGRFFGGSGEAHYCLNCLQERPAFSLHRSCGRYEGKLKDIILLYKYGGFKVLGKEFARFAHRALRGKEDLWWEVEALIPVPLHRIRKRQRGFNQTQIIAKELAKLKEIEIVEGVLVKVKHTVPQTFLEAEEREKNVAGAFKVRKRKRIEGKRVLVVDDVYTTGATIRECSRVLKEAGAEEVRALTLAQA